jgi:hypothetical protein
MRSPNNRLKWRGRPVPAGGTMPKIVYATSRAMLCEVRFYSEAEWAELSDRERPVDCAHKPGVGWICAVPTVGLN